jgi:hypothetical protein
MFAWIWSFLTNCFHLFFFRHSNAMDASIMSSSLSAASAFSEADLRRNHPQQQQQQQRRGRPRTRGLSDIDIKFTSQVRRERRENGANRYTTNKVSYISARSPTWSGKCTA